MLKIPLLRYVADLFSADRQSCAQHALDCFARVVRAVLGHGALQKRKMECAAPLDVLGVTVSVGKSMVTVWPTKDKIKKWSAQIDRILNTQQLDAGEASKMAGRLGFAAQFAFSKLGRAMLRPIFAQQYACLKGGRLGPMLDLALWWWKHALQLPLKKQVPLSTCAPPCHRHVL